MLKDEEIKLAKRLFNDCWEYIEKQNRTYEDNLMMLHLAHASRFHWGNVGTLKEAAIGEWQCSYVYSLLGYGEPALVHAQASLRMSESLPKPNFLIASATHALAFASFRIGRFDDAQFLKVRALELLDGVSEEDAIHIRNQISELPF
jgi:hypothetical protein